MDKNDPEIECPYNKSHMLLRSRMQTHLVKCRKAFLNSQPSTYVPQFLTCMHNANHHIYAHELDHHQNTCPNMGSFVRFFSTVGEGKPVPYTEVELPPSDENWDEDPPVATYDPSVNAASKRVLRQLKGASRAERKTFRLSERDRIGQFDDESATSPSEAAARPKSVEMNSVEKHAFTDEALRRPRGVSMAATNSQLGQGRGRVAAVPTDIDMPGVGRATCRPLSDAEKARPVHANKRPPPSSCSSASTTNEDDHNRSCSSMSMGSQDDELVEATAELRMAVDEKGKEKTVLQTSSHSDAPTWQDNTKRTDSKDLPSRGRGKFARKK